MIGEFNEIEPLLIADQSKIRGDVDRGDTTVQIIEVDKSEPAYLEAGSEYSFAD